MRTVAAPLVIPSAFELVPPELHEVTRTLTAAAAELEGGDPGLAVHLAWLALESALIWAMRIDGVDLRRVARSHKHDLRMDWGIHRLGLPEREIHDLYEVSKLRRYRFEVQNRTGQPIRSSKASRAIEEAARWIPDIASSTQTLSPGQMETLRDLLSLRRFASARLSLPEIAEIVGSGIYDSPLAATFRAVLRRHSRPHTPKERGFAANLAYFAAHQAVNQGMCSGRNGSFAWTQLARRWGRDVNGPERLAHLDRLDSIAHELLGNYRAAMRAFVSCRDRTNSIPHLRSTIINREARVFARLGDFSRAAKAAAAALSSVNDAKDTSVVARRHLTLGIVSSLRGDHIEAITHLEHGLELHTGHQMITKCNGAMYLMDACRRANQPEQFDRAIYYANMTRSLAERYGYTYNLRRAKMFDTWIHRRRT